MSWRLSPAAVAALPALVALEREAFASDRFNARQFRYLLTQARATCLVAADDDRLLGYAVALYRADTTRGRLYGIAVADAARGQGVATALVEAIAAAARAQGCTALGLEVRADNDAALGLYRKLGFVAAGVLPGYYEDGAAAIRMRRDLAVEPQSS